MPSSVSEDSEVIRVNMTPLERRQMHDILGDGVEIAAPKTNGDAWNVKDPAQVALLDQIQAACTERDAEMAEYQKAEPIARRAGDKAHGHWTKVRAANERALRLRAVLDELRKVPRP